MPNHRQIRGIQKCRTFHRWADRLIRCILQCPVKLSSGRYRDVISCTYPPHLLKTATLNKDGQTNLGTSVIRWDMGMTIPVPATAACFLQFLGGLPEHVAGVNINGGSAVSDCAAWKGRSSIRIQKQGGRTNPRRVAVPCSPTALILSPG
jgi:hypothetical protein